MKKLFFLSFLLIAFTSYKINAQIINIPADYPTIQQGIDASHDGDTVLVQPGTYAENIDFFGKAIKVGSLCLITGDTSYISQTIINGGGNSSTVSFLGNETNNSVLNGFTITNGWCGILVQGSASPTLKHLLIKENLNYYNGSGINISCHSPMHIIIDQCIFENNNYARSVLDVCNVNTSDTNDYYSITNSIFRFNLVADAVIITDGENGIIDNVLIYNNDGKGIGIMNADYFRTISNSTIVNNTKEGIFILYNNVHGSSVNIKNCIIWGNGNYQVGVNTLTPMTIFNIDKSCIMNGIEGVLVQPTTQLNWLDNFSENPNFQDESNFNYRLNDCSPAIGFGSIEYALPYDIEGNLRPNPEGSNPDIGAFENELGIPFIPPTITANPVGTSKCEGESYTMMVDATGSPEITFQWQKNYIDIPGETNNVLILSNLIPSDEADYRCLVTNSCETKYSNQAFIEVKEAPDITSQPQDEILYFGNDASFTVNATGDEPLSYQWYGPSGLMENDTLSQLQITGVSADDVGNYYCTITNICGSATSNSATLAAYNQLIVNAGTDVGIILGDSTQLNGSYTGGSPSLAIHWTPDTLLYDQNILSPQTVALYNSQAFTLNINDLLVGYQTSDEVFVTVIEDDTLEYFGSEDDTLYQYLTRGYCGYISGNNCDLDKIKANYFTDELISYDVEKVLLRFGKAVKTSTGEIPIKVGIWEKSLDNEMPGDLIDYATVPLSQIVQDVTAGILTTVTFPSPVAAPKDFFVGVFLPQTSGDTVALKTNIDGNSESGIAWTLNASNEWISYSSDPRFFLRVSNAIFPVVRQNNVGINDFIGTSDKLIIFPNPANDILYIMLNESMGNIKAAVIIYDLQGKAHISKQIENDKSSINISILRPGVYIIKVKFDQTLMTRKLIVY